MKKKKKLLMVTILLMTIGFASVTSTLIFNGTLNIGIDGSFKKDVVFTRAETEAGGESSVDATGKIITFTSKELTKVGDSTVLDFDITNHNLQYDATAEIECNVSADYNEYLDVIANKAAYQILAGESVTGNITTTLIKPYTGDALVNATFTCTLNVIAGERNEAGTTPTLKYAVGDEVRIGTENFYVTSSTKEKVKILAKYNLSAGNVCSTMLVCDPLESPTYLQNSGMIGSTKDEKYPYYGVGSFSNTSSEYSGSIAEEYINKYVDYLNSSYNLNVTGDLITEEELEKLGCVDGYCTSSEFPWVYSSNYWTKSTFSAIVDGNEGTYLKTVHTTGNIGFAGCRAEGGGYRPLLTISTKELDAITSVADDSKTLAMIMEEQAESDDAINFSRISSGTNGKGVYSFRDNASILYYRGNVTNNNITFGGFCWKAVRTTEDGGVKLIYSGKATDGSCASAKDVTISASAWNETDDDNAYLGYMYGAKGAATYALTHENKTDSTIKKAIDNWYKDNLLQYGYLFEDAVWCNDRLVDSTKGNRFQNNDYYNYQEGYTTLGYAKNKTWYDVFARVGANTKTTTPSIACQNENDRFTVSREKGNGVLQYPVGMLTADEIVLAGAVGEVFVDDESGEGEVNFINRDFYLYSSENAFWTMSPAEFDEYSAKHAYVNFNGSISENFSSSSFIGVRPSVVLNNEIIVVSGNGSLETPYTLR